MLLSTRSVIFAAIVVCLYSCTKEVKGPPGEPGAPGVSGSENVTSTEFVVPEPSWIANADSIEWVNTINAPALTDLVVQKGSVQVFINRNGIWYPLPYSEGDEFLRFGYSVNTLKLFAYNTHYLLPEKPVSTTYKLTVITPR